MRFKNEERKKERKGTKKRLGMHTIRSLTEYPSIEVSAKYYTKKKINDKGRGRGEEGGSEGGSKEGRVEKGGQGKNRKRRVLNVLCYGREILWLGKWDSIIRID